jgi:hypothetical protein
MPTDTVFDFAKVATKFKAKSPHVLAYQHRGEPFQIPSEHGSKTVVDGEYVVQVGEREQTETILPRIEGEKRIPGSHKKHRVPVLDTMSAEDFEGLYESQK